MERMATEFGWFSIFSGGMLCAAPFVVAGYVLDRIGIHNILFDLPVSLFSREPQFWPPKPHILSGANRKRPPRFPLMAFI